MTFFIGVELFDRLDQSDISFLDQVQQVLHPYPLELQGDLHHQTQVGSGHDIRGFLIPVFLDAPAQLDLFFPGQQPVPGDLIQITLNWIRFHEGFGAGISGFGHRKQKIFFGQPFFVCFGLILIKCICHSINL